MAGGAADGGSVRIKSLHIKFNASVQISQHKNIEITVCARKERPARAQAGEDGGGENINGTR